MHRYKATFAFLAAFAVLGTAANAKPNVRLQLDGELVTKDAKGVEKLTPIAAAKLEPGDTVRYDIVATNDGSDPATTLLPVGRIPVGTAYEAGSASSTNALRVEFSLDGGKTWSKSPIVKVVSNGVVVEKKADPAAYTTIRWIAQKPLAPKSSVSYRYEVRVK